MCNFLSDLAAHWDATWLVLEGIKTKLLSAWTVAPCSVIIYIYIYMSSRTCAPDAFNQTTSCLPWLFDSLTLRPFYLWRCAWWFRFGFWFDQRWCSLAMTSSNGLDALCCRSPLPPPHIAVVRFDGGISSVVWHSRLMDSCPQNLRWLSEYFLWWWNEAGGVEIAHAKWRNNETQENIIFNWFGSVLNGKN